MRFLHTIKYIEKVVISKMKFFYENKDLSTKVYYEYGDNLTFEAHLHNQLELVYMIDGRSKAMVDWKECIIGAGDALIVFPNQVHQYKKIDKEYYFISIFSPDFCPEFENIFKQKIPVSPIVNLGETDKILSVIKCIVKADEEKKAFYDNIIKGYFLVLLSYLFRTMDFEDIKTSDGNTIKAILNYCTENYTKDLQLETISHALHISKYYISHLFSEKLHIGFNEYIGMLRISEACRLLELQKMSITEIAYNVGFNSARTLNRLFLKYIGMTPRQYKKGNIKAYI